MKKLYRSQHDCMILGICGGIGQVYGIDPTLVRLGLVLTCLLTALLPVALFYFIAGFIIPKAPWA